MTQIRGKNHVRKFFQEELLRHKMPSYRVEDVLGSILADLEDGNSLTFSDLGTVYPDKRGEVVIIEPLEPKSIVRSSRVAFQGSSYSPKGEFSSFLEDAEIRWYMSQGYSRQQAISAIANAHNYARKKL